MRAASTSTRFVWAALFALLLAVRSLAPSGFMPALERGTVTIVACPDAGPGAPPMEQHGDHKSFRQPCPYAAASAVGALGPDWAPVVAATVFAAVLLARRTFLFVERHGARDRPPLRGPPNFA